MLGDSSLLYTADIRTTSDYGTKTYELAITNFDTHDFKVDVTCIPNDPFEPSSFACTTIVPPPILPNVEIFANLGIAIPPGITTSLHTGLAIPQLTAMTYLFAAVDSTSGTVQAGEFALSYGPSTGLTYTPYAMVGDIINTPGTPIIRKGKIDFDVANYGLTPVTISTIRIPTVYSFT
jgi:hypothetical protein